MIFKTTPHFLVFFILSYVLGSTLGNAQDINLQEQYREVPDDPYVAVSRASMPKSPAYTTRNAMIFTNQVNIDADGNNIVGDAANEPSIAVDPTNPDRIVIGWRQFDIVSSNFRQAGYAYSLDGGETWTFPGPLDPGNFRSDPVLDFDNNGNFYYNSLQGTFACDVFAIRDGGVVWEAPVPAHGGDKQWMRVDRTNGDGADHIYAQWNQSFSVCEGDFTRSSDDSLSYEACASVPNSPRWGTLAVDEEGILYIVGTTGGGFEVTRSLNARNAGEDIVWETPVAADLDGFLNVGEPINPAGLVGQVWVDVDISDGSGAGNVYVAASVGRFSNSDPGDVMFARSTDGGLTFEPPVRINTDTGTSAYQWFGTMSVAPNGRIDIIWLDTRDAPSGTFDSVLYYSFSEDQGTTWSENTPLSVPFNPNIGYPQQDKMGDYFDMVSDNEAAHLAWTNTINGGQDVYYSRITPEDVLATTDIATGFELELFPSPFDNELNIRFTLPSTATVKAILYDSNGRLITTLTEQGISGRQTLRLNAAENLSQGLYFVKIEAGQYSEVLKVLKR